MLISLFLRTLSLNMTVIFLMVHFSDQQESRPFKAIIPFNAIPKPQPEFKPKWCPMKCSCEVIKINRIYESKGEMVCNFGNWTLTSAWKPEFLNITDLKVKQTVIEAVTSATFYSFANLIKLQMLKTKTSYIGPHSFSNLKKLKYVSITENRLQSYSDAFHRIPELLALKLSNNLKIEVQHLFSRPSRLITLQARNTRIASVSSEHFTNLRHLHTLDLGVNLITELDNDSFNGLHELTKLKLFSNKIRMIHDLSFKELISLKILDLTRNRLSTVNKNLLHTLVNLQKLYMNSNYISTIHPEAFSSLTSATFIYLSNNRISTLSDDTFKMTHNLRYLYLNQNQITKITASLFRKLHQLRKLYLQSNRISFIDANAFKGLRSILQLSLNENNLVYLQNNLFPPMATLRVLDISRNQIQRIHPRAFRNLTKLQELTLSMNNINLLPNNIFADLHGLEYLSSSNANISQIQPMSFMGLSNLRSLAMTDNNVDESSPWVLYSLYKLESLVITNTGFSNASYDVFHNLTHLRSLNIAGCGLKKIKASLFKNLNLLTNLNLDNNELEIINNETFLGLSNLKKLSLQMNKISYIATSAFSMSPLLDTLYLSGNNLLMKDFFSIQFMGKILRMSFNRLHEINFQKFLAIDTSILDLSWNKIRHIHNFPFMPSLSEMNLSDNRIYSGSEINLANLTGLQAINLKSNGIISISSSFFKSLRHLSNLTIMTLSFNKIKSIADNAFMFLNLKRLDLFSNLLIQINFLAPLNNLQILELGNNKIRKIVKNDLQYVKNLKILYLVKNEISQIEGNAFENLQNLEKLNLSSNPLSQLPSDTFNGLHNLSFLVLNSCEIKNVTSLFHDSLSNLKYLSLANNHLDSVHSGISGALKSLESLILDNNHLVSFGAHELENFTNIKLISLSNNKLREVHLLPFFKIRSLKHLKLSNVGTIVFDDHVESIHSKLISLDLSYNKIKSNVDSWSLRHLNELYSLDISGNKFKYFRLIFEDLLRKKLRVIKLANTDATVDEIEKSIEIQVPRCYGEGTHVEGVRPSCNYDFNFSRLNWTKLPKVLRIYGQHLQNLNLTRNNLRHFDFGFIFSCSDQGLHHLHLRSNNLNSLTNVRKITLLSLKSIDLSNNNLTNICEIPWATFAENLEMMDFSWNNIKILTATCFKGLKRLTNILMQGNSLVEIKKESFFYTPLLKHIRSTRLYLCCMVPASIQTCYPLRKYDGLSTCDGLLSHVTLQMYIWLVGCIAFIGNIAVFTLHIKSIKTKKNPVPIFLIANLAISDFIVANYLLIIAIGDRFYSHYNFAVESEHWLRSIPCLLACFICCAASLMSVFMMLVISIDRYVCIVYPFSERKLTVKSAFLLVACCWLFSIIFVGIPVMYSVGADGDNRLHGYSSICMASNVSNPYFKWWITAFTLITIICWIITCILYGKMLSSIRQSSRNVRKSKSISKDKRIAIRLFLILVTDLISWIPYYIVFMHVLSTSHSVDMIALQFTIIFALPINSAVNPCLYTLSSQSLINKINRIGGAFRGA